MNIKFKRTISIRNFLVVLYTCFCYTMIEGASLEKAEVAESLTFTPRCQPILLSEFNKVARSLYEDCIYRQSIAGKNALKIFKKDYDDLSGLDEPIRLYIENIHLVQAALYKFIEDINEMKMRTGIERLLPAITDRESLVLAVAHCAFDYDNSDLGTLEWVYFRTSHWLKGSNLVTEVTVNTDGIILKMKGTPISESTYNDHPLFKKLCSKTADLIKSLKEIVPVIEKLKSSERLKLTKPAEKQEKKEEEKK